MGCLNGYSTMEQLKKDTSYTFNVERGIQQRIMKATIIENN